MLPDNEIHNPRYGLSDTQVIGEGITDFAYKSNYIDIGLYFLMEALPLFPTAEGDKIREERGMPNPTIETGDLEENLWAELRFSNNIEALIENGESEEDAKEIAAAVDILCKHINRNIVGSNPEFELHEKELPERFRNPDGSRKALLSECDGIITIHGTDE